MAHHGLFHHRGKNNSLRNDSMFNMSSGCMGIAVYREMAIEVTRALLHNY